MKNKFLLVLTIVLLFAFMASPTHAAKFSDDFNEGLNKRWDLSFSPYGPGVSGNWRVEDGVMLQDLGGDGYVALVKNVRNSSQIIETQVALNGPSGYGGVTLWFSDLENYLNVRLYPAAGEIWVEENSNFSDQLFRYTYPLQEQALYTLRIGANSDSGELDIYLNDVYIFTHTSNMLVREGKSGINAGNAGGYFDNFSVEKLKSKNSSTNN